MNQCHEKDYTREFRRVAMDTMKQRVEQFFTEYESRMNTALKDPQEMDVEGTVNAFAKCFVESSPKGVICGENNKEFREKVPQGIEWYRSLGTKWMKIVGRTITSFDELHSMARVHWRAFYRRKDGREETIEFDVVYLVRDDEGRLQIFCYITGDEEGLYREKGLIPE